MIAFAEIRAYDRRRKLPEAVYVVLAWPSLERLREGKQDKPCSNLAGVSQQDPYLV